MSVLSTVIARGLRSAQPAATTLPVGSLYYVTDETATERSNGTTWDTFSPVGGSGILVATLNITNSQFDNGNTTPLDIVAAPGAGKIVIPVGIVIYSNVTVTKATNPTVRVRWNGDTTDLTAGAVNVQLNSTGEWFRSVSCIGSTAVSIAMGSFDMRNKSLQYSQSANTVTGTATGKLRLAYFLADIN